MPILLVWSLSFFPLPEPLTLRPNTRPVFAPLLVLALALLTPAIASAQSVVSASVRGTITDDLGQPIPRAVVTLEALAGGTSQEAVTGAGGTFAFPLAAPGTYEIRAEAFGYRPVIARTLDLAGGDAVRVPLSLVAATPPVVSVDTVAIEATAAIRARAGGVRLGGADIDELPTRFGDLSTIVARAPAFGPGLGSQGLPGSMSVVMADGIPVYRAAHPTRRSEHVADAFFPRTLLSSVTAFHNPADAEWAGAAGGYAAVATLSGVQGGVEAQASWSGTPLWSSGQLGLDETPGLTSYQVSGRTSVEIRPDTTQLVIAAEGLQHEAPMAPRIGPELAQELSALGGALAASLAGPSVERISRYSGLGRFYTHPNERSRVFVRGTVSYSERTFDGVGSLPSPAPGLGETSTEFSLASSFVSEISDGITLELRGGVSASNRTFDSANPWIPSAYLAEPGIPLGDLPGVPAEASRTDFTLLPVLRWDLGPSGAVKTGASVRAARHDMQMATWGEGDFLFTDADALLAGRGLARVADVARATFTTREVGVFAQYDVTPTPGLDLSLGARLDYEQIPEAEPSLNAEWLAVSGLSNTEYPAAFPQVDLRGSFAWDPAGDGRTSLYGVGSLQSGDVDARHLFEAFARDGAVEARQYLGSGLSWLDATVPGSAGARPTLALLGPDVRPPRSLRATAGVVREIAGGVSVHLSGDFRRTDFLMRRRDLNLPTAPSARDPSSRAVYGTLAKDGALVATTDDDWRRFPSFGAVWALDPDGWSEYRGVTAGLEYRSARLSLYGAFTRSETRDNWIGAARGSADAELAPHLPDFIEDWSEGRSDFDVPNRVTATALFRIPSLPGTSVAATYRFASGRPFTPGYRLGVDANGDGSFANDVPFVPQPDQLGALHSAWPCLQNQAGGFAVRNSCRGPSSHNLSARVQVGLGDLGGQQASFFVEGLNLIESQDGLIDQALMLVDPDADLTYTQGDTRVAIPLTVNPEFGNVMVPTSRGRMLRVGLRIGG